LSCEKHVHQDADFAALLLLTLSIFWQFAAFNNTCRQPTPISRSEILSPALLGVTVQDRQWRHSTVRRVDKPTVIGQLPMPKQTGQHRQRMISQSLIDERFLALKGFSSAASGKFVNAVQQGRDDLGKQFSKGGEPSGSFYDCDRSLAGRAHIVRRRQYRRDPANTYTP
jgi:uncharacterized membrane protein YgcG